MKVYIVTRGYDYEGSNIIEVFSTFTQAKEFIINDEIGKDKYEELDKSEFIWDEEGSTRIYSEYGQYYEIENWEVK